MPSDVLTQARRLRLVDLAAQLNNVAITPAEQRKSGACNVWGNSFSAAQMPDQPTITVAGIEFRTWHLRDAEPDNIRCAGQLIELPAGHYDWIHLIATGERRVEDELCLHFADHSADFEAVRVSDFWAAPAMFGETPALRSEAMHYPFHVQFGLAATAWHQRVPVTRRAALTGLRLPDNPALHVFALSLQPSPER
ncbi:MAG: hypothetical protein ABI140_12050 [Jatrophihabitantaceae bacterium]